MSKPRDGDCDNRARLTPGPSGSRLTKQRELSGKVDQPAAHRLVDEDWARVLELMPMDLEDTARDTKALVRRRGVRSPSDLLRLVLAYVLCDWPLVLVAAWACLQGVANLSDVAVMNRLRAAKRWIGVLVAAWVSRSRLELAGRPVRLRLMDATTASAPGSKGGDWRLHVGFDLGEMCMDGVEVTDKHGGETLVRHPVQEGDIVVADRGYCHRPGIGKTLSEGGELVVRVNWQTLPVKDEAGRAVDLFEWLRQVPEGRPDEREVVAETPYGDYHLRLIARRLPQEAVDRARYRLRHQASKKQRNMDQRSLEAAGFIILVTSLPRDRWSAGQVLALYRLRWQVELLFKRLKGVLCLDHLRAKDPDLAQVYLLGKILAAMIVDRLSHSGPLESIEWFCSVERPASPWRWLMWWTHALRGAICGAMSMASLLAGLPELRRYFCNSPRRRRQHSALARCLARLLGKPPTVLQGGEHANSVPISASLCLS